MSEDHRYAIGPDRTTQSNSGWHLVEDYRATDKEDDSFAYKSALMRASSLQNQVMICSYQKDHFTYWEIWEYK